MTEKIIPPCTIIVHGHKSNRLDLPTEMSVSDVDDIVAVLQGNDGEYITNMIGGQDKIGTSPIGRKKITKIADVKSLLMGLKLLTDNAEDNKAQAIERCAA